MTTKRGTIAAIVAGAAVVGSTAVAALQKTRQLQDEARAKGAHVPKGPYEAVVKRPLGAALATTALVVLSPVLAASAVGVRAKLGSPVIFRQERPGLNGRPFHIYKFRTMTDERDPKTGKLLSDEDRLTEYGLFLRGTSIDELPELVNVVRGEMSLIGPRPLIMSYLPLYNEKQARRHEVRPGLTGWAQVNGRNLLTWEDKFDRDVEYVDNVTFATDARIFFETIGVILSGKGVSSGTSATMEAFTGTPTREAE